MEGGPRDFGRLLVVTDGIILRTTKKGRLAAGHWDWGDRGKTVGLFSPLFFY